MCFLLGTFPLAVRPMGVECTVVSSLGFIGCGSLGILIRLPSWLLTLPLLPPPLSVQQKISSLIVFKVSLLPPGVLLEQALRPPRVSFTRRGTGLPNTTYSSCIAATDRLEGSSNDFCPLAFLSFMIASRRYGQDLWLALNQLNIAKMTGCMWLRAQLRDYIAEGYSICLFPFLAGFEKAGSYIRKLPYDKASSQHPARKWGPLPCNR